MGRQTFVAAFVVLALSLSLGFTSQVSLAQSISDYAAVPPTADELTAPLMMLVMSRDNQLWHKAYNDYSDLDGDTILDTSYKDNVEYYGYFNSGWCYGYQNGVGSETEVLLGPRFTPITPVVPNSHRCTGYWSGNFLNWLTTTRIDVVRKVLYGGYRAVDNPSQTVLQRAFIPNDNHAFVKIVRNSDLGMGNSIANFTPIEQTAPGYVVSFCNVTDYDFGASPLSRNINILDNPPKLKVAVGYFPTWAGSERNQCMYRGDSSAGGEGGDAAFTPARPSSRIANLPADSEMAVRVEVCVAGRDDVDKDACRTYVAPGVAESVKPYGLLQKHGEPGEMRFGLMTGSYVNNTQGGVLRKNISFFGGPDANEDDVEVNASTGVFYTHADNPNPGIIKTLNTLRIQGWNYNTSTYSDCNRPGILKSQLGSDRDTRCQDWGNPISEIYLEAIRYLSRPELGPTSAFNANDSTSVPGLLTETWADPYRGDALCAKCSIVVLSTGLNNFDGDGLNETGLPAISLGQGIAGFTDLIGEYEGLNTGRYVVGRNGVADDDDDSCTAKAIPAFSDAQGACPEVPSLEGSFNIAGAAFYAHQTNLRESFGEENKKTVKTFTVSLAESIPTFETSPGISFVPTCHSSPFNAAVPTSSNWSPCTLVDLTVEVQTPTYSRMLISWEDSLWGNDYDMDAYVMLEYCTLQGGTATPLADQCEDYTDQGSPGYHDNRINYEVENGNDLRTSRHDYRQYETRPAWQTSTAAIGTLQMRVSVLAASAGFAMKFGYIVNGSFGDGSHDGQILRYGGYDYNSSALTGDDDDMVLWDKGEALANPKVARLFRPSSETAQFLKNPLWYAAKYGNFIDFDGGVAGRPDRIEEWDRLDLEGNEVAEGDGYPDAYFPIKNPARLPAALSQIFLRGGAQIGSGTSASVNAQTSSGEGAIYQALYSPAVKNNTTGEIEVRWVGALNALFIDSFGNIRDDSGAIPGQLDSGDHIIETRYDEADAITYLDRYAFADGARGEPAGRLTFDDNSFQPIWSAQKRLAAQVQDDATPERNRDSVSASASTGRFIFTAIDRNGDGIVTSDSDVGMEILASNPGQGGESDADVVFAFEAANFLPALGDSRYLDLEESSEAAVVNTINYIRGIEVQEFRARTVNDDLYVLGDVIHSNPVSVARPQDRYDLIYGDTTYREFFERYKNRRNIVYVGANDGMLHAFNAGFFDATRNAFCNVRFDDDGCADPTLGQERWAYVPYNVIPHLKWLTAPEYPHIYYVDGPVQSFDVNIWPANDPVHTNGWGTIIVVGLRFGGGEYSLDHNGVESDEPRYTRSSYIVMDVTDPERNPELIAEISHPNLGYTTSMPSLMKARSLGTDDSGAVSVAQNEWHLVFGSGPRGTDSASRRDALVRGVSNMPATLFSFDLRRKVLIETILEGDGGASSRELDSYVGNFTSMDWNMDYVDDAIYFGLVSGSPLASAGKLKRGVIDFSDSGDRMSAVADFFNPELPFSSTPLALRDANNDFWVYAGTGRYLTTADNDSVGQQSYFGLKEPKNEDNSLSYAEIDEDELFGTTNIDVYSDGRVRENGAIVRLTGRCSGNPNTGDAADFDDIAEYIEDCAGWTFDFTTPPTADSSDALRIRTTTKTALAGQSLVVAAFEPSASQGCSAGGLAWIYTPHRLAGIPGDFAPLGVDSSRTLPATQTGEPDVAVVPPVAEFGVGPISDITVTVSGRNSGGGAAQPDCNEYNVSGQNSRAEHKNAEVQCDPIPAGRRGWAEIPVTW